MHLLPYAGTKVEGRGAFKSGECFIYLSWSLNSRADCSACEVCGHVASFLFSPPTHPKTKRQRIQYEGATAIGTGEGMQENFRRHKEEIKGDTEEAGKLRLGARGR
jgi:hypothetical protein